MPATPRRPLPKISRTLGDRKPKRRFFIFCEGKKTEPAYLKILQDKYEKFLTLIIKEACGEPSAISTISSETANRLKKSENLLEKTDQVWAVFDRDEHFHFDRAIEHCRINDVFVARSNPCFEVWLILHYVDYNRPVSRHDAQRCLERICPEYDRTKRKYVTNASILDRIDAAEIRAQRSLQNREEEGDPFGAPSTTFHHLTSALKRAAEENR